MRLLIVEDTPEDVELIVLSLEAAGIVFDYDTADHLTQCRQYLLMGPYDVVLSDYRLPGFLAPQVLELVKALQPQAPFILVTGSLGEEAAVDCIKAGMTDYVLKDRLYRLGTVIHRALAEATLRQQRELAIAQLEQQAWRESVLNQIVQAMRGTLVLDEVIQITLDHLHDALRPDLMALIKPTPDHNMVVRYVSQQTENRDQALGINCFVCATYWPHLQQQGYIILHRDDPEQSGPTRDFFASSNAQSLLLAILDYHGTYYGAFSLHQISHRRPWSEAEVSLIRGVAENCAIAIYQVELYQQAQKELAQRRRMEDQLRYDAFHDALTGLPNRALFLDRLTHALQISQRRRPQDGTPFHQFAVLFLDLDSFRIINDSFGHDAGDTLLKVVADRLGQCLRSGDTLARTSGDEFALLLEDICGLDDITMVVDGIHTALAPPIVIEGQEMFISACIGVVFNNHDYTDAAQFLRDADTAMYQAKGQGRGRYQVFNESMHIQVRQRLRLESNLRRAISRDELILMYQPVLHLPSQTICGFEALIRWQDPHQGLLPPHHFIPVAEQTGLILPIGQWVLSQACRQLRCWLDQFPSLGSLHMAVNLSTKQFAQPDLLDQVDQSLAAARLSGSQLRLEITESALLENEAAAFHTVNQLRQRQIQVAIDDFGTGYASLSYLLRFPKDVLKIDKSFVSHLEGNLEHQEIIKMILTLGKNLGLEVVGEGIETPEHAAFLVQQGCLYGQGYWFYPPLTAPQVEQALGEMVSPNLLPAPQENGPSGSQVKSV